jgi:hypothetical protein
MTSLLDPVFATLPNHLGFAAFFDLRESYGKAIEKLGPDPILPLMPPEAAAFA